MNTITVTMLLERGTRRRVVYQEVDAEGHVLEIQDAAVGTVYLKKSVLGTSPPQMIMVSVTEFSDERGEI